MRHRPLGSTDPWDARTLEWTTASPPPDYNFDEIPTVHALDDFWHRKYAEDKSGRLVPVQAGAADRARRPTHDGTATAHGIHLPEPVVLAARGGARPADHRLRRHLFTGGWLRLGAGGHARRRLRLGARALGGGG